MSIHLDPKKDARLIRHLASACEKGAVASQEARRATKTPARDKSPGSGNRARLAPGEGDRIGALAKLAARGWRPVWDHERSVHYFVNTAGERGPEFATYRKAVDGMLKLIKEATRG